MLWIDSAGPFAAPVAVAVALVVLMPAVLAILGRFDEVGVVVAVLGSAAVTALAGLSAVLFETTTRPWFWAWVGIAYAVAAFRVVRTGLPERPKFANWKVPAGILAGLAPASLYLYSAPVAWDARSVWFFHASWFTDPSVVYSQWSSVYTFSQVDYPPLVATWGAFSWLFGDSRSDWIPQMATGVLTLAALALVALLLSSEARSFRLQIIAGFGSATLLLAAVRGNGFDGYADGLAAALVAAIVLMAFLDTNPVLVGTVALTLALAKNEGLLFIVAVVLPLYLLRRRNIIPLLPGLAAGVAWMVVIRQAGAPGAAWHFENALPGSDAFIDRIRLILGSMWGPHHHTFKFAAAAWLGVAVIVLLTRGLKRLRPVVIGTGVAALLVVGLEVGIYLATPFPLEWHLSTSVGRLLMHPTMLFVAGATAGMVGFLGQATPGAADTVNDRIGPVGPSENTPEPVSAILM